MKCRLKSIFNESDINYPKFNLPYTKCMEIICENLNETEMCYERIGDYLYLQKETEECCTKNCILAVFALENNKYVPYDLFVPVKTTLWVASEKSLLSVLAQRINEIYGTL